MKESFFFPFLKLICLESIVFSPSCFHSYNNQKLLKHQKLNNFTAFKVLKIKD